MKLYIHFLLINLTILFDQNRSSWKKKSFFFLNVFIFKGIHYQLIKTSDIEKWTLERTSTESLEMLKFSRNREFELKFHHRRTVGSCFKNTIHSCVFIALSNCRRDSNQSNHHKINYWGNGISLLKGMGNYLVNLQRWTIKSTLTNFWTNFVKIFTKNAYDHEQDRTKYLFTPTFVSLLK